MDEKQKGPEGTLDDCFANIGGSVTAAGFGRGGTPKDVSYIDREPSEEYKPNISGTTSPVSFGRGGTPKDVKYIVRDYVETKITRGDGENR